MITTDTSTPITQVTERILPTTTKTFSPEEAPPPAAKDCTYVVEVSLPEKILSLQQHSFEGEVINKGNCLIQKLNLYASQELQNVVEFSPSTIESLPAGRKSTFQVIRKSTTSNKKWVSILTGSAVINWLPPETITGNVIIEVVENGQSAYQKNLPVQMEVPATQKIEQTAEYVVASFMIMTITIIVVLVTRKPRRAYKRELLP